MALASFALNFGVESIEMRLPIRPWLHAELVEDLASPFEMAHLHIGSDEVIPHLEAVKFRYKVRLG